MFVNIYKGKNIMNFDDLKAQGQQFVEDHKDEVIEQGKAFVEEHKDEYIEKGKEIASEKFGFGQ